jgi:hypothetical protein
MKLATYRTSQYETAFEALTQGGIYDLSRVLSDDKLCLEQLQHMPMLQHGHIGYDFHIAMEAADEAFQCCGESGYAFIICGGHNDSIPMFQLDRSGGDDRWVELDLPKIMPLLKILEEVSVIENYSGIAYCPPGVNGAGNDGDDIHKALCSIRNIIFIEIKRVKQLVF